MHWKDEERMKGNAFHILSAIAVAMVFVAVGIVQAI